MAKRFKLKIPSFQFCRPKRSSSTFPEIPKRKNYSKLSPVNPKALDICYPNAPVPPPSTPVSFFHAAHVSSKIRSIRSRSGPLYFSKDCCTKPDVSRELKKSSSSSYRKKKAKQCSSMANSLSIGYEGEEDDDGEPLLYSKDYSYELRDPLRSMSRNRRRYKKKAADSAKAEGGGLFQNCKEPRFGRRKKTESSLQKEKITCDVVNGKLKESFVMEKKSDEPYEDFKRSMMEMILENEIFDAKGLEELLHCFLTLNSSHYHGFIVQAFSEVWKILFHDALLIRK